MELLPLLLLVPVIWLMWLPSRIAGAVRRHRMAGAGVLAAVAVGGALWLSLVHPEPPVDYAASDATLRALIE